MAGGRAEDFERARPVIEALRAPRALARAGRQRPARQDGNQICIAGVLQGLAEGLHFAEQAGLDPHAVVEVHVARAPRSRGRWTTATRR